MAVTRGAIRTLLSELVEAEPGTMAAERKRADVEQALMRVLKKKGPQSPASIGASLRATKLGFHCTAESPVGRWQAELSQGRLVSVVVQAGPELRIAHVEYCRLQTPRHTKRQREKAAPQAAFYERYMAAGRTAYAVRPLAPDDRLILVIGELEADVNNGGFRQYLENKGDKTAREAAVALERIGAKRTLRLLKIALAERTNSLRLEQLDQQFQQVAEDLPGLTMKFVGERPR